jgi:hypothetical protein
LVAGALRAHQLQLVPHVTDESAEVLYAWSIAFDGKRPLVHTDSYNGPLWPYSMALVLRARSGIDVPRVYSLAFGLAAVVAAMGLAAALVPRSPFAAAAIAGAVQAVNFTHVLVGSRIAWSNSTTPFWTAAAACALVLAARRGGTARYLVAGALAGLALHTHPSVLVFLAGLGLWYALEGRSAGRGRLTRREPWLALGAAIAVYLPVVLYNIRTRLDTFSQASDSRNVVSELTPAVWLHGVVGLLDQLGRSLAGGFDLSGVDADWVWVSRVVVAGGLVALVAAWRRGVTLPLTVVAVCAAGLPLVNNNWSGFLEARYLGFLTPLIGAAIAATLLSRPSAHAEHASLRRRTPVRRAVGFGALALALTVSAGRVIAYDKAALATGYDNRALRELVDVIVTERRVIDLASGAERDGDHEPAATSGTASAGLAKIQTGAPQVVVSAALAEVQWPHGGHPRRAVEYYLTLAGVAFERASDATINHYIEEGRNLLLIVSRGSVDALAWEPRVSPLLTVTESWGLYAAPARARPPPDASSAEAPARP